MFRLLSWKGGENVNKKIIIPSIVGIFVIGGILLSKEHMQSAAMQTAVVESSPITVPLQAVNKGGVGQTGKAVLTEKQGKVIVAIAITGGAKLTNQQPVNLHSGACDAHGPRAYTLHDIINGHSVTTIDATFAKLKGQYPLYIDAHKSDTQRTIDTMCGNLP